MIYTPEDLARMATFDQLDGDDVSGVITDAQRQWYALSAADRASLLAEFEYEQARAARKAQESE